MVKSLRDPLRCICLGVKPFVQLSIFQMSMDWFKGHFTGKSHDLHGKIPGFRLRFYNFTLL